jgi:hypothetical protein
LRIQRPIERIAAGIPIAHKCCVYETSRGLVYDEPTVMWRMRRSVDLLAHAVIGVIASRPVLVWYINDRPLGYRTFDDFTKAIQWSDQLQAQNWAAGWRAEPE